MRRLLVIAVAAGLLATGCGTPHRESQVDDEGVPEASEGSSDTGKDRSAGPARPSDSGSTRARSGARVIVDASEFGPMLYSAEGQAIYLFDREDSARPRCYGECAVEWPPVLTGGEPVAGRGTRPGLLGTTDRRDGTTQVTYAGHPLYFYAHEGRYEVLCHDFYEFGGTWFVVQPSGRPAPPTGV